MSSHDVASLTIVGCGAMGSSIARGLVAGGFVEAEKLWLCDAEQAKAQELARELRCQVASAPQASDITLLCVKPQVLASVAALWASNIADSLVVSIAAGVTLKTLETLLPQSRIVRVMPNLCVAVRQGASAVCAGNSATPQDAQLVQRMFCCIGSAAIMTEAQLDVAGALSGCGPAYLALFVDALTLPAIEAGLPASVARELLLATFEGTAKMLKGGDHPRAFMERVMSPGGTTVKAVGAMEPLLSESAKRAVGAALEQTHALAKEDA